MNELIFKHTFWPSSDSSNGWLSPKFHFMSVCLSYHQLNTIYKKVSLTTDSSGYDLLINGLELKYENVDKNIEYLENEFEDYWVLKKLYSLSLESSPFLNVDCDFYFFRNFKEKLSSSLIVAQNYEYDHPYYIDTFNIVKDNFPYVPDYLKKEPNGRISAINAGIIGGTNNDFFKIVFNEVKIFLKKNRESFLKFKHFDFNMFLEQFFIKKLSEAEGIEINYLKDEEIGFPINYNLDRFYDLPHEVDYLHTMNYKTNPLICEQIAQRLFLENPKLYYRCEEISKEFLNKENKKNSDFNRMGILQNYMIENVGNLSQTHNSQLEDLKSYEYQIKEATNLFNNFDWEQISITANNLLSLPRLDYLKVRIKQSAYFKIIQSEWDWSEINHFKSQTNENKYIENLSTPPTYHEVLLFYYKNQNFISEYLADPIDMLIIENTVYFKSIENIINEIFLEIIQYQSELDYKSIYAIILSRIKTFIYQGLFQFEK